jgi:hypothetical protein
MSDEDSLGSTLCFPRRIYVLLVAIGFLVYGVYNALYYITLGAINMTSMKPTHGCHGAACDELMSCSATLESSYNVRLAIVAIGSLVFGIIGTNAIYNKYAADLYKFSWWLVVCSVLMAGVLLMDASYLVLCRDHYSYNIITEVILWPIFGLPVSQGVKYEIRQLNTYPSKYVNALTHHNMMGWYVAGMLLKIAFFAHAAFQSFVLSQRFHYGMAGMGANFSIEGWRKRLMLRYEINEVGYNTMDLSFATAMDMGWEKDEYKLTKPLNQPHWYRGGMMPGPGMGNAYDGFHDDRRNVLL